jgi:hypothetical protein
VCPGKALAAGAELTTAVAIKCFPSLGQNSSALAGGAAQSTPTVTVSVSPSPF